MSATAKAAGTATTEATTTEATGVAAAEAATSTAVATTTSTHLRLHHRGPEPGLASARQLEATVHSAIIVLRNMSSLLDDKPSPANEYAFATIPFLDVG